MLRYGQVWEGQWISDPSCSVRYVVVGGVGGGCDGVVVVGGGGEGFLKWVIFHKSQFEKIIALVITSLGFLLWKHSCEQKPDRHK